MSDLKDVLGPATCARDANGRNQGWGYPAIEAAVNVLMAEAWEACAYQTNALTNLEAERDALQKHGNGKCFMCGMPTQPPNAICTGCKSATWIKGTPDTPDRAEVERALFDLILMAHAECCGQVIAKSSYSLPKDVKREHDKVLALIFGGGQP